LKGIYVLLVRLSKDCRVRIGALGDLAFECGLYGYVGSAQNGLEQRVKRHLRKEKALFWHIDYLLAHKNAKVENVLFKNVEKAEECNIAALFSKHGEQVNGFGCSDCACKSHLFKLNDPDFLFSLLQVFPYGKNEK
jgi:Uri superfamily endonuclease